MGKQKQILFLLLVASCGIATTTQATLACHNPTIVVGFVTELAKLGQYNEAILALESLPNYDSQMDLVVSSLYDGNITNTKHIFKLFSEPPVSSSCVAVYNGLTALWDKMTLKRGHYGSFIDLEVFLFHTFLGYNQCTNNASRNRHISSYIFLMESRMTRLLSKFERAGARGERQLASLITKYEDLWEDNMNTTTNIKHKIVNLTKIYLHEDCEYVKTTTAFLKEPVDVDALSVAFATVVDQLKAQGKQRSEDMLLVGYFFHKTMENNGRALKWKRNLQKSLNNVAEHIPGDIQGIFLKGECTIKNYHWDEYLIANEEPQVIRGGNGEVFTWMPSTVSEEPAAKWFIKSEMENGDLFFTFRNMGSNEPRYLCKHSEWWRAITCSSNNQKYATWYLKPIFAPVTNESVFQIKNSPFSNQISDYLQAVDQTENKHGVKRRLVLSESDGDYSYWKLDCSYQK